MSEERKETCETCRFWDIDVFDQAYGSCRRHAPQPSSSSSSDILPHKWPFTNYYNWCGEYQPQREASE